MMITKKAIMYPLKISLIVMFFTVFVYLFGPIKWIDSDNIYEIICILLIVSYILSFAFGYYLTAKKKLKLVYQKNDINNYCDHLKWIKILSITIFINLILTIGEAFIYADVTSIGSLWSKMIQGLFSPSSVYYSKDASSRADSIIVWISFFYSPLMYVTNVLSLYFFRRLKIYQKCIVITTFAIETMRWLAVGTNKGLFDIVLLFVSIYIIKRTQANTYQNKYKNKMARKKTRRMLVLILILIFAFFTFFTTAISSRVNGEYSEENFQSFPYNLIPENYRLFVEKFDSYLVQGYDNFEKIIENCSFNWTYGFGNSRFLSSVIDRIFNVDITSQTYPYQLQNYGVDPLISWHSAYAWFASDLTFGGIIILMFLAGKLLASLTADIIRNHNPISMALFYLMILAVFNASCTNYVLAFTNGFMGFWSLLVIYGLYTKGIFRLTVKPE